METVKAFLRANAILIVVVLIITALLYQFVDPAPPNSFTIATGGKEGRYYEMGQTLKRTLAEQGFEVEVVETAGSSENLELLADENSPVSIAFVQSGMEEMVDVGDTLLMGLGSLYYEPIWIFRRSESELPLISDFAGKRILVGGPGSGTLAVARYLLRENGLLGENGTTELIEKGGQDALEALRNGEADVGFFSVSARSKLIKELTELGTLELMDVRRSPAYAARFQSLSSVVISEGLLDMEANIPSSDRRTLASTATLVINERFHPALTPLVLDTFANALKGGGVLEKRGEFPSPQNIGLELTKEADHYFEYGPPFLMRYMPFWAASLVDRLIIFIIPLLVILIPLSKLAGPLYRWRIRSRIYRWYRNLLDTEHRIISGIDRSTIEDERRKLGEMENELGSIEVPLSYADELYLLKQHVGYVYKRLDDLEAGRIPCEHGAPPPIKGKA